MVLKAPLSLKGQLCEPFSISTADGSCLWLEWAPGLSLGLTLKGNPLHTWLPPLACFCTSTHEYQLPEIKTRKA